jgi:hypothetical protein
VFGQLDDPRIERKKLHPMPEILLLTLCAIICGAESWDDIELFGLRGFFRAIDTHNSFNAYLLRGFKRG